MSTLSRVALIVALLAGMGCKKGGPEGGDASRIGKVGGNSQAPEFSIPLLGGGEFRLADHRGKHVVLLDFWQTTCQSCAGALAHRERLAAKHRNKGLVILAVSIDDKDHAKDVEPYARAHGVTVLAAHDADGKVAALYDKHAMAPYVVLIARDGSVIKVRETFVAGDEATLENDVEAALGVHPE